MAYQDDERDPVVDKVWIDGLHGAGIREWPRALIGESVNQQRVYYLRNEVLVDRKSSGSARRLLNEMARVRARKSSLNALGVTVFTLPDDRDALDVTRAARRLDPALRIAPHYIATTTQGTPSISPATSPRPAFRLVKAAPACASNKECVAIVDTGIWEPPPSRLDRTNPANQVFYDPQDIEGVSNPPAPPPGRALWYGAGHGGFIAGIVANRASGVAIRVASGFDPVTHALTIESLYESVDRVLRARPRPTVLNLSLGSYADPGTDIVGLREAVEEWSQRALIVAAAGNHSTSDRFYPAGFADEPAFKHRIVSVGATEPTGEAGTSRAAPYSNFGSWVNAWAPGTHISYYPEDLTYPPAGTPLPRPPDVTFTSGLAEWSGTSFAAPFAAAEITRFGVDNGIKPGAAWAKILASSSWVVFG
jgi:hypothetical protein